MGKLGRRLRRRIKFVESKNLRVIEENVFCITKTIYIEILYRMTFWNRMK